MAIAEKNVVTHGFVYTEQTVGIDWKLFLSVEVRTKEAVGEQDQCLGGRDINESPGSLTAQGGHVLLRGGITEGSLLLGHLFNAS